MQPGNLPPTDKLSQPSVTDLMSKMNQARDDANSNVQYFLVRCVHRHRMTSTALGAGSTRARRTRSTSRSRTRCMQLAVQRVRSSASTAAAASEKARCAPFAVSLLKLLCHP
ncbi:hypothetical protein DFH08DRAFT_1090536, partial [Mycena albidolilacea]